jgi:hypothetical protein
VASSAVLPRSFGLAQSGLRLGLNSYSLRALSHDTAIPTIIQVMKEANLQDCQLLFSHAEPARFTPWFFAASKGSSGTPPTAQQLETWKATAAAASEWRLSVPMTYFEDIRSMFEQEGLKIRAYAAMLGSSEVEIDRLFLMAKALGAEAINTRIPESLTKLVAAAADRHQMVVGLQVSDLKLMLRQRTASRYFKLDPDIGDLTKIRIDSLQFVNENYEAMSSVDLKDAELGGTSVPFGEGASHMKDVLLFLQQKPGPITAYIDCDYPGTGRSREEVHKCISYVRRLIA